jgi:hypothetical protein
VPDLTDEDLREASRRLKALRAEMQAAGVLIFERLASSPHAIALAVLQVLSRWAVQGSNLRPWD